MTGWTYLGRAEVRDWSDPGMLNLGTFYVDMYHHNGEQWCVPLGTPDDKIASAATRASDQEHWTIVFPDQT